MALGGREEPDVIGNAHSPPSLAGGLCVSMTGVWWCGGVVSGAWRVSGCEPRPAVCVILRKEVIQPQVPLRLPCYDLVPIGKSVFGAARRLRTSLPFVA